MKKEIKTIFSLLLFELIFFCSVMPQSNFFVSIKTEGYRWIFAYMFFIASAFAAVSVKKPAVFGAVLCVCSAAAFVLAKKSLLLSAPVALMLFLFINFVEKQNAKDLKSKKQIAINAAFPVICAGITAAAFPLNRGISGFNYRIIRFYLIPIIVFLLYFAYSLLFKSSIAPAVRRRLKKQ